MEKVQPEFRFLEQCRPGELIRLNLGDDRTEWAIAGQPGNALFPVLVLSGATAPHCLNAAADSGGNLKLHFQRAPALSYDHRYTLLPDLVGPCDVHSGPLFSTNGALILTGPVSVPNGGPNVSKAARFLRAEFPGVRPYVYFNLSSGGLSGYREGDPDRAAFGRWTLSLDQNESEKDRRLCVMQFAAAPPAASSKASTT
jgi:hypothetical protein